MKILVVVGAGYIGSHMVKMLFDIGHNVVTLDSLISGHRDAIQGISCKIVKCIHQSKSPKTITLIY